MLPEPNASLLLGLIVGDRGGLPKSLTDAFRATGTSHVLAVSGYNVMLVTEALVVGLALLGLARRRAALLVAGCVAAFVLLAGADPPVLRAGIMGSVGLLAALLGRRGHGGNAFAFTAAAMLMADPLALRHDVSFRLSFFAVAGLSAFGSPLAERMRFIPFEGVRSALAETLGATIATLPIALHDFGSLAVASPVVNVMIAPLVPFSTAVGAAGVIVAFISPTLALPASLAVAAALRLMREIVGWWADAAPAVAVSAGFRTTAGLYAALILLWYALKKKTPEGSRR
jgi:competence protein ComEC